MNRTDRLLAIVLELQGRKNCRAEELAAIFETSKRTIYRDIQALCEAGVPVIAIPGIGYKLSEGYFLPPLTFNADEAVMLLLGTNYIADNFDQDYQLAALSACRKIMGVLPEKLATEVQQRQERIRLMNMTENQPDSLKALRRAVIENQVISFEYHARQSEAAEPLRREVEPYAIVFMSGAWYLSAYCYLRQGMRHFRLERISQLKFTGKNFQRQPDFLLGESSNFNDRWIIIKVLFSPLVARWVRESRYFYITDEEEVAEGLLVTLTVRKETDALGWVLSWGQNAQVLEPESLRQQILATVERILENYKTPQTLLT
jgi:predicted DNA-binding transcriptional regulator YafY